MNPDTDIHHFDSSGSWVLFDLLHSGNYEATISESLRYLNQDPEDSNAHFCITFAYLNEESPKKAKPHLDFLIQNEPESTNTHLAAVGYYNNIRKFSLVKKHAEEGMRIDPENSAFYFYAAVAETSKMNFAKARSFLKDALRLSPDNTDYLNLQVRLSAVSDASAESSWKRVEELKNALKHDPHSAVLHNSLGDVFLDELDSPAEAEFHFREALKASPKDSDYQRDLFNAVGHRDLLYRMLSIPSRCFRWIGHFRRAMRHQPWRVIFLIIGIKLVIAFLAWRALATILFWPACKVYEWLLVSEISTGALSSVRKLRLWYAFQRLPRWFRFRLFLAIVGCFCLGAFAYFDIPIVSGITFITIAWAVHFLIVLGIWTFKSVRRILGKRRRERKNPSIHLS